MYFQAEKDVLSELNTFITGATQIEKVNPLDLSKTALSLLKTLPTARDAVLEYFCNVFDIAVNNYIVRIEKEIATGEMPQTCSREEATVSEIHTVLCSFISGNPQAWAPIISTWSLELLGELSSRYAGRAHVSVQANLNETLQLWMGCRSTRTLIDITTQCLTCLMDSDSETWMNALLDTSVKHSPNFDWVVAHVGSCFPNTVIIRVLSCGLKDFCQHKSMETGKKAPKLASVVGILGHLAGSHFSDIRTALLELFNWSLQPYNLLDSEMKNQKLSTVPFLLQLASMSSVLLNALSTNIKQTLKGNIIFRLSTYINEWCKYFGSAKVLQDLIVHLILDCEFDGLQVINLLLDHIHLQGDSFGQDTTEIRENCREILEYVLQELDSLLRINQNSSNIKLLTSLTKDISDLHILLLRSERLNYETATRIIILIGKNNPTIIIKSACFLLRSAKSFDHLAMLVKLIHSIILYSKNESNSVNIFDQILKQTILETVGFENSDIISDYNTEQMLQNLLILLKWEKSKQVALLQLEIVSHAILTNVADISYQLGNDKVNKKVRHVIAEILFITITSIEPQNLLFSPNLIFSLVNSIVSYFFLCCTETDFVSDTKGCKIVCELLKCLTTYSEFARVIALREILECALFKKESLLFGADPSDDTNQNHEVKDLLLYKNHKHSTTMMLAHRQSSVFHSGVIGDGKRKPKANNPYSKNVICNNVEHLLDVIKACCSSSESLIDQPLKKSPISLDALTLVSLLLVQFVSPDVMYNGLPWPEEEFSKVTIERDLYIRRVFNTAPILWQLLRMVATYRPVLCYCSVLLRALTATLLHQWSIGTPTTELIITTENLLDILAAGQLLPPPLSSCRDLVRVLSHGDVVQILRAVWNYLRAHIPSPELFTRDVNGLHWRDPSSARPSPLYTDTLRMIMFRNIDKMGEFYAQLFVNLPELEH